MPQQIVASAAAFYLRVNGLLYSPWFRLWDYCRTPVFLSK